MKHYQCTICKNTINYDGSLPAFYPFCSDRCKMVDLGHWFSGQYSLDEQSDENDQAPPDPPNDPQT